MSCNVQIQDSYGLGANQHPDVNATYHDLINRPTSLQQQVPLAEDDPSVRLLAYLHQTALTDRDFNQSFSRIMHGLTTWYRRDPELGHVWTLITDATNAAGFWQGVMETMPDGVEVSHARLSCKHSPCADNHRPYAWTSNYHMESVYVWESCSVVCRHIYLTHLYFWFVVTALNLAKSTRV